MSSNNNNKTSANTADSAAPGPAAQGGVAGGAAAPANPPCPTAPSMTLEHYNEIRVLAEEMLKLLPPGSYYQITENPDPTGQKYKIAFLARSPGCPPDCQHCRDEAAANGIPRLSLDTGNDNNNHKTSRFN
ncbi:hypothetical protein QBC37DRAFT_375611 [Rhypophila decipiens]|uniref:Uncharacterized protein n=1 Tax=Rhypophila decipiens TaxID=261697 RepID=A0AAN6Y3J9_9PEZI|nr:hypothetical protein QBC37DRAFT_375611 [Rhypophila decipiens]